MGGAGSGRIRYVGPCQWCGLRPAQLGTLCGVCRHGPSRSMITTQGTAPARRQCLGPLHPLDRPVFFESREPSERFCPTCRAHVRGLEDHETGAGGPLAAARSRY